MTPNHIYIVLLLACMGTNLLTAFSMVVMWWKHHELSVRAARLETILDQGLSPAEVRKLFEKISSLEGQMSATNQMLRTVQEHLLESDK